MAASSEEIQGQIAKTGVAIAQPQLDMGTARGAFRKAVINGDHPSIDALIAAGFDINLWLVPDHGFNALMLAASHGLIKTVEHLLHHHADVHEVDCFGNTPLLHAVLSGHHAIIALLVAHGANPRAQNHLFQNALMLAASQDRDDTIIYLQACGAFDVDAQDIFGGTAVLAAAATGSNKALNILRQNRASMEIRDYQHNTPLILAAINKHQETVTNIIETDQPDINETNYYGFTAAMEAEKERHADIAQYLNGLENALTTADNQLLKLRAEERIQLRKKLFKAASDGHDAEIEMLISQGIDINDCSTKAVSALMLAASYGHRSTIALLLNNGAKVNAQDFLGRTPLIFAIINKDTCSEAVILELLQHQADVNLSIKSGITPLMCTAQYGSDAIIALLAMNGASVTASDNHGKNVLMYAAINNQKITVESLIDNYPIDLFATDEKGNTAADLATIAGHLEMANYLQGRMRLIENSQGPCQSIPGNSENSLSEHQSDEASVLFRARSRVANTSRVYEYNRDIWVVSLVVYSPTEKSSHTKIVIEGLTDAGIFYYNESHIGTRVDSAEFESCLTPLGLSNIQGKYFVICNNYSAYSDEKLAQYAEGTKRSWSISRERALAMISEIKRQEAEVNEILRQSRQLVAEERHVEAVEMLETLPNYQYAGKARGELMGGNNGHNCLTWCEEKLTFADIHPVSALFDGIKAAPKKHTHPFKGKGDGTVQDIISPEGDTNRELLAPVQSQSRASGMLLPAAGLGIAGLIVCLSLWKPEVAKGACSSLISQFSSRTP
jgi:ankyrin repeat protein